MLLYCVLVDALAMEGELVERLEVTSGLDGWGKILGSAFGVEARVNSNLRHRE